MRQKAHFIAQPTCVEMQKVSPGESGMNTDSMRRRSSSSSRSLVVPSDERSSADDGRARDAEQPGQARPERLRQVRHLTEVGDAAREHPAVDLAGAVGLDSSLAEEGLEFGPFEAGDVGEGVVGTTW